MQNLTGLWQRHATRIVIVEQTLYGRPLQKLHHDIQIVAILFDCIDTDDVVVSKPARLDDFLAQGGDDLGLPPVLLTVGVTSEVTGVLAWPPNVATKLVTNSCRSPGATYTCVESYCGPTAISGVGACGCAPTAVVTLQTKAHAPERNEHAGSANGGLRNLDGGMTARTSGRI